MTQTKNRLSWRRRGAWSVEAISATLERRRMTGRRGVDLGRVIDSLMVGIAGAGRQSRRWVLRFVLS